MKKHPLYLYILPSRLAHNLVGLVVAIILRGRPFAQPMEFMGVQCMGVLFLSSYAILSTFVFHY